MLESRTTRCPYCGEMIELDVDCSAGNSSYIEDCSVCCQPMEIRVDVATDGHLLELHAGRGDD